jgi:succinoglycan biosynthesis transport protein ExoP
MSTLVDPNSTEATSAVTDMTASGASYEFEPPEPPEFSPFSALARFLRGRKRWILLLTMLISPVLGYLGYINGTITYETQAILRVYPQQSGILYDTGDDSVLKTFEAYVKAETSYVTSILVMQRAFDQLVEKYPELSEEASAQDLTSAIKVRRQGSLIYLSSTAKSGQMVHDMLATVANSYLALRKESDSERSGLRLRELEMREAELLENFEILNERTLKVGGEYGVQSLARAHLDKVAQIDSLVQRRVEVSATLEAMRSNKNSSADMSDEQIMRATLLDRALADLNFDRAKRQAELEALSLRYRPTAPQVMEKQNQIAIIDQAMAERREQIKVLGQTGALTDTSNGTDEVNIEEIQQLLEKVAEQVERAREEARDLNAKRIELRFLAEERDELRDLLDETRRALEVLRLESDNALPGLSVLMSPPVVPTKPADDTAKIQSAAGVAAGFFLALLIVIIVTTFKRTIRFSDDLWRVQHLVKNLRVVSRRDTNKTQRLGSQMERLRNDIMLMPARAMPVAGRARVISVISTGRGRSSDVSHELAVSFAKARLNTILVDADLVDNRLTNHLKLRDEPGWSDVLNGTVPDLVQNNDGLLILPGGSEKLRDDSSVAIPAVRWAILALVDQADVLIINAGNVRESLSAELLLSSSDLGIAVVSRGDKVKGLDDSLLRLDELPRNGGASIFVNARSGDPGLA